MQQLQQVHSIEESRQAFLPHLKPVNRTEFVPLLSALGRVLAAVVVSPEPLPCFARSTMDGYAVRSRETAGASESLPALLEIQDETLIGDSPKHPLRAGAAAPIATGAALPEGADAVVMVEYSEQFDSRTVAICRPVAMHENVLRPGEDIPLGTTLFQPERLLSPGDLGALAALGILRVQVFCRPRVAVFATGNELVPSERMPSLGQVRDINSYTLAGQISRLGAEPSLLGILPDDEETIYRALVDALQNFDLIVLSGGSSLGTYDLSERVLNRLGEPGVLVHGLAMKPGKPTLLAVIGNIGCIGFPGHPLSALMTGEVLLPEIISLLARRPRPIRRVVSAVLSRSVASLVGRTEFIQIRLECKDDVHLAIPIQSKSAIISAVTKADGYMVLEQGSEGRAAGEQVLVHLWGEIHG